MFETPKTYQQGMEEMVIWANALEEKVGRRFMLDCYKIYMEWRYLLETAELLEEEND